MKIFLQLHKTLCSKKCKKALLIFSLWDKQQYDITKLHFFWDFLTHCVIWSRCLFYTFLFPVMLLKCLHYDSGWVLNEGDCDEIGKDLFGWSGWEFHQFGHVEKGIYADEKSIPETNCCIEGQGIEPITFCNAPYDFIEQGQRCCGHYHNQRLKQTKIL